MTKRESRVVFTSSVFLYTQWTKEALQCNTVSKLMMRQRFTKGDRAEREEEESIYIYICFGEWRKCRGIAEKSDEER